MTPNLTPTEQRKQANRTALRILRDAESRRAGFAEEEATRGIQPNEGLTPTEQRMIERMQRVENRVTLHGWLVSLAWMLAVLGLFVWLCWRDITGQVARPAAPPPPTPVAFEQTVPEGMFLEDTTHDVVITPTPQPHRAHEIVPERIDKP